MFITQTSTSPRRTMLKGMGATMALPFLDAMVPAGTASAQARRDAQGAPGRHRDGARRGRQHRVRHQEEPVGAGGDGLARSI